METLAYRHNSLALTGRIARPTGAPKASVLIFPTVAGPNQLMEARSEWLASLGYIAMVADYYGHQPLSDFNEMQRLAGEMRSDSAHYRARLTAALDALRGQPDVQQNQIAVIGYCMGGQAALELARAGHDFAAAVSLHGLLDTQAPARKGRVHPRILVCHGHWDPMAPPAQVSAFQNEMVDADAQWHMHIYGSARHGFTDPASNDRDMDALAYDLSADRQSKAAMLSFFDEVFE